MMGWTIQALRAVQHLTRQMGLWNYNTTVHTTLLTVTGVSLINIYFTS